MKLSILVLHNLGDPLYWRQSLIEKELCLPNTVPDHNYVIHDSELSLPDFVKEIKFDAIILTQTFLSKRNDPDLYKTIRKTYEFIKDSTAFKIALPQDDYTCNDILDRWMVDWNVDLVYTVCTNDWDILYKTYIQSANLKQGYTGYISNALIERGSDVKKISQRPIDVSYRAAFLSPVFGKLGQIKTEIGDKFKSKATGFGLTLDLSTRPADAIVGTKWFDFIEDSKCMLGVNSGSSLLDPEGKINIAVYKYMQLHPSASYDEVEAACFPGQEGIYSFPAISPRNIECGMLGTAQLLTPGPYGNFMQPWEDYIPIEPDMSNIDTIIPVLKDITQLEKIAAACKAKLLSYPELRYLNHVDDLIVQIMNGTRLSDTGRASTLHMFAKYKETMVPIEKSFWWRKRTKIKFREELAYLGARRAKYLIKHFLGKKTN
jgi:hypothetical protein